MKFIEIKGGQAVFEVYDNIHTFTPEKVRAGIKRLEEVERQGTLPPLG